MRKSKSSKRKPAKTRKPHAKSKAPKGYKAAPPRRRRQADRLRSISTAPLSEPSPDTVIADTAEPVNVTVGAAVDVAPGPAPMVAPEATS